MARLRSALMDDLEQKLTQERARLVGLLTGLATALGELPAACLAEVLPMLAGVDDIVARVRSYGLAIVEPSPECTGSII